LAGICSPDTGKFSTALRFSAPHSSVFPVVSVTIRRLVAAASAARHSPGVAVGGREAAAGGAEGVAERLGRMRGDRGTVPDGDCERVEVTDGASRRKGTDQRVDGERLVIACDEVAGRAEHVRGDEQAAVVEPERDLVPSGEPHDAARLDLRWHRGADEHPMAGGDGVGVAAVAIHQERDPEHRRFREGVVEAGRVERIGEQPALVQPDRGRGSPQELVRVGEPREAPVLVEAVRLQGAGW